MAGCWIEPEALKAFKVASEQGIEPGMRDDHFEFKANCRAWWRRR